MVELVVVTVLLYVLALFGLSRRRAPELPPPREDLFFVVVVPCLDEELVIGDTLAALLERLGRRGAVLVVDDASSDRTAEIVREHADPRVWLLERRLPAAQRGKGDALNAAYAWLARAGLPAGISREDVVVAVLDADGRLDERALTEAARYFVDPDVGAVQVAVEMRNADTSLLARLQDFEFAVFTEIFQRARQRLGSVGLGGNGQFVRFSALASLGPRPWRDCLTEDLDLGARLLLAGWKNAYCPGAVVTQQAVTSLRRWLRQRTRWFHGHLQCWRLLPAIIASRRLSARAASDLVWYLTLPVATLLVPLSVAVGVGLFVAYAVLEPAAALDSLTAHDGLLLALVYVLTFGPAYLYAYVYRSRDGSIPFWRAALLGHLFELYAYLWFLAGWLAVSRLLLRRGSWAKTARTREATASTYRSAPGRVARPRPVSTGRELGSVRDLAVALATLIVLLRLARHGTARLRGRGGYAVGLREAGRS